MLQSALCSWSTSFASSSSGTWWPCLAWSPWLRHMVVHVQHGPSGGQARAGIHRSPASPPAAPPALPPAYHRHHNTIHHQHHTALPPAYRTTNTIRPTSPYTTSITPATTGTTNTTRPTSPSQHQHQQRNIAGPGAGSQRRTQALVVIHPLFWAAAVLSLLHQRMGLWEPPSGIGSGSRISSNRGSAVSPAYSAACRSHQHHRHQHSRHQRG